jgi:hypothetical protein
VMKKASGLGPELRGAAPRSGPRGLSEAMGTTPGAAGSILGSYSDGSIVIEMSCSQPG